MPDSQGSPASSLLAVDGLSVAFDTEQGERRVVEDVSFSRAVPARRSAWSANPAAARASPPCPSCACCRARRSRAYAGRILFEGDDLLALPADAMRGVARRSHRHGVPGADDEPQSGALHRLPDRGGLAPASRPWPRKRRAPAVARDAAPCRHRRAGAPARPISPSALGRPAPAGDDRHGACLPAPAADRRRADDRARRHHPGADPRSAAPAASAKSAWPCC